MIDTKFENVFLYSSHLMCEVNIDEREFNYTLIWGGDRSHFSATGNWALERLDCFIVYEVETCLWRNYELIRTHLVQGFLDGFPKRCGKDGKEQNSHNPLDIPKHTNCRWWTKISLSAVATIRNYIACDWWRFWH